VQQHTVAWGALTFCAVLTRFLSAVCSAILLPIVITFYVTYHFLQLFDGIFSVSTADLLAWWAPATARHPSLLAAVTYPARIGLQGGRGHTSGVTGSRAGIAGSQAVFA
jgi:hypothetical protein